MIKTPMFKKIITLLYFVIPCIINIKAVAFTNHGASGFRSLYNAYHIEADFNNDGYMDVLAAGNDGSTNYCEIYLNNQNLTFSLLPSVIPQLSNVVADVADYNNDGYIDIAVSGINAGQKYCRIFKNNGNNTFTSITAPVEDVAYGTVLWADFNNDGILDLFTCGINQAGSYISRMYKGENGSFTLINTNITPTSSGTGIVLDYNNDGFVDVALTGYNNSGQIVSYLFGNKRNFTFESVNAGFERVTNGDMFAADINADGYSDVLITGTNHLGTKVSDLYLNNNGVFVRSTTANLDSLSSGSIDVADFNNDGFSDILLTGTDNRGYYGTILHINNQNGTFTKNSTLFPALTMASAAIADFDKDNDIDIILSGKTYTGNLADFYTNDATTGNTAPAAPASLTAVAVHDSVTLSWNKSNDNETPSNGLSYNLYIGTSPGTDNLISPASALPSGTRKVIKPGNVFQSTSLTLKDLPEGNYYWSVQSIDNNYDGSEFAAENSFTICRNLFVGQDTSVCLCDTINLHAGSVTDQVNWFSLKKGLLASNTSQTEFIVSEDDRVIVELTKQWGCVLYDTIDIEVIALPTVNLGNDTSVCLHSAITLNAGSGWKQTSWFNGNNQLIASDTSRFKYTVSANATFVVAVTDNKGCKDRDTINISQLNLPSFTTGADQWICFNDTAQLSVSQSFPETKWYGINSMILLGSGSQFNYKVNETDTILARVEDNNKCVNTDTVVVNMRALPDLILPNDTSVCFGQDLTISSNKKFNQITWYSVNIGVPVPDTSRISFKVSVSDVVKCVVSDVYGCENKDSITVTKLELPVVDIGADTSGCINAQLFLNAKPGWKRVDWYKTGDSLLLADNWFYKHTIAESIRVWARVANDNNCVNDDTISIIAYPLPAFSLGNDTSLCKNNELKLKTKDEYINTLWKSSVEGIVLNGPDSLTIKVIQNEVISAIVTDFHQCQNADTISVHMFELPELDLGPDTTICYHSLLRLKAGDNWKNINWIKTSDGTILGASPVYERTCTSGDSISVRGVDLNGCNGGDTLVIKVAPLPDFSLGADRAICIGTTVSLSVSNNSYQVKWYSVKDGMLQAGNSLIDFSPHVTDTVIAIANSEFTCQGSDTIVIRVNSLPAVNAGNDTLICYGDQITLGGKNTAAGNGPFVYSWYSDNIYLSNTANPVITGNADKKLRVKVTDLNGCENADTLQVLVNPQSTIQLAGELSICRGQMISLGQAPVLKGSRFPYEYQWYPDSTLSANNIETPVAKPTVTSTYRLVASSWNCPADTAYVTVIVRDLPAAYVSPTLTIGNNGSIQLYAEGGARYRWRPADNLNNSEIPDPVATPPSSTLYTVEVIDSFGCSSEASVQVNVRNEVFVPEIFTPNGDGQNDVFKIYGFGFTELSLTIYDRNNNVVYESIDMNEIATTGWNGTYHGKALESGNYRWVIKGHYADGQAILFRGKNTGVVSLIK